LYNFDNIVTDLKSKLEYYFRAQNQDFGTTVNHHDIVEYLMDATEVSDDDNFDNIKGIRNLIIRDIDISVSVYEPNDDGNYPQYVETLESIDGNVNAIRKVTLGFNQFPVLHLESVQVDEES
jgi:hypothetical protein